FLKNLPADWYLVSAHDVASAKPFVVDVRQPDEYAKGFIDGAVNIPLRELAVSLQALPPTNTNTVVVSDTGHRSALGMAVLQNDPPLARQTGESRFLPLKALMGADIITLHVPLSRTGPDATYHLFDAARTGAMKPGSILINASRGAVVETAAIRSALLEKHLAGAVLDVWEKEPAINAELLSSVTIGTAHVAGYSLDGKVNAVRMIYRALCGYLNMQPTWAGWDKLPAPATPNIPLPAQSGRREEILQKAVGHCYDIELDDRLLREMLAQPEDRRASYFMKLRTGYRMRREFFATTVDVPPGQREIGNALKALGFCVV
ncbi:DUF3410 domain-containing protein, partial [bacterium]